MEGTLTLRIRQSATLDNLRRLSRLLNLLALLACVAVVFYVASNFAAEALWPPAPPAPPAGNFFGADDAGRAVHLINPALRWLARIISYPAFVQALVGCLFCLRERPFAWKLVGAAAMYLLAALFWVAGGLSCGC